eukprot:GHRR01010449.1.p1 GENE.GHRR01010449.1~~GHRR01010449.1.p1  ORF type:complete len:150 (+),score=33.94 GHRR01010449.1:2860-3309(+)
MYGWAGLQYAPGQFNPKQVQRIKQAVLLQPSNIKLLEQYCSILIVNPSSSLIHPAGYAGPSEMALALQRRAAGRAVQSIAFSSMLTGNGVPPKKYASGWYSPVDTPVVYKGPYPMSSVNVRYDTIPDSLCMSGLHYSKLCPNVFKKRGL